MSIHICKRFGSLYLQKFPYLLKPKHVAFTFSSRPERSNAVAEYFIDKHKFSPETAAKVYSAVNTIRNPENSDLVLSFLKETGFSKPQIEFVIQRVPHIISYNLNRTIKPKFKFFEDFGISLNEAVDIIVSCPWILSGSVNNSLGPSILALKSALGRDMDLSRVLKRSGIYLIRNLEKTLIPNIEFLKNRGASSSQITTMTYKNPRFMSINPERMKEWANRADEMGFAGQHTGMFIHALLVVSSMSSENLEHKLQLFRNLGFSDADMLAMFRRMPQVFTLSENKMKEVTQLLLSVGGEWKVDISYIVNHPHLLTHSPEQRLKPRIQVLDVLVKKKLLLKLPNFSPVCKLTDDVFHKKFVLPFSNEVGKGLAVE